MTKIEAENIKEYCLDYLKLHHERAMRAKKRNPNNADWHDGLYEGARLSLSHLIDYVNKLTMEDK